MKKTLISIILMTLIAPLNAQTYYPFPTDTAQWSVIHAISYPTPGPNIVNTIHQNLRGDTIINGKTYYKIYETYFEDYFLPNQYLKCFIREDTSKKIYIKYPVNAQDFPDTSEFVLYDFNLAVGDTFCTKMEAITGTIQQCRFRLDSIGSINTNTGHRKKYIFTFISFGTEPPVNCFGTQLYWIEGVGSMIGPFYNEMFKYCQSEGISVHYNLICYQENFNYIIGGADCHIITGMQEKERAKYYINAYPNPANETISFVYEIPENYKNASIKIYNIIGVLCAEYPITPNDKGMNINLKNFDSGVYFYTLFFNKNEYFKNELLIVK